MKLHKITTLWKFIPVGPKGYDLTETFSYWLWVMIFVFGMLLIFYKNIDWFTINQGIFIIKIIKYGSILWITTAPISYYFAVNEVYNHYIEELDLDE